MRAVVMEEFGGPEVLQLRQVDAPDPGPGQVLVQVEFAGVTFVETQVRAGRGAATHHHPPLPRIPGNGVGGRIVALGEGADPALLGTVVVTALGGTGGYAELAVADAASVVPVPAGVDLADATALLADGRTAVMLHDRAEVRPGEWVLVEAAGGGVGSLLVQLAAGAGGRVVGAARGDRKRDLVRSLGATAYVDYATPGWSRRVVEATGGAGVDAVFDGVGGEIGAEALTTLRPGGRASIFGMASGAWTATDGDASRGIAVLAGGPPPTPAESRELTRRALELAAADRLRPIIGQRFPLAEAAAAHRAIEARTTIGKTLLVP